MSGSGGGSGFGGQFGGEDFAIACDKLTFSTQLSSPQEEVIDTLNIGDELLISIQNQDSQTSVVAIADGHIAGGIASPQIQRLRECIQQGTVYTATVQSINGGQVRIHVHPVGKP